MVRRLVALTILVACTSVTALLAQPSPATLDSDGTVHVSELTIPRSDLVQPGFSEVYVQRVRSMLAFPRPPAMDAPKAAWDRFDADVDRSLDNSLAWNQEHYPVTVADTHIAGVHVGIVTPRGGIAAENRRRVLINLHGGGFFAGRGLVKGEIDSIATAYMGRIRVITVDYRQAPYYKYPAASEDVESVYRELLKSYQPQAIGIFGCSAGGTLAAQSVAWLHAKGLPRPGAIGIFCAAPVRYGSGPNGWSGDSAIWGVTGLPLGPRYAVPPSAGTVASQPTGYMEGVEMTDPKAYPGSSDAVLAGFPPTLFVSGTRSGEMSDVIVAHAHLLQLGVDSYLYLMEGGWHGAVVSAEGTAEGHDVNAYVARWFGGHLAR